ncbi:MAG TPA: MarR family transcriptional regulator [Burkholderiales bacterium]|nr:MarR family transcriptional regulator [Burkholderiales bacterium]
MSRKPSEAAVTAWARLIRAQQTLLERVEGDLKAAGLPPLGWYDVLLELARMQDGKLRQSEICEKALLSKYNLSRLLDRLEEEGLVKRHPCKEDGRAAVVTITAAGKTLQKKMWSVYEQAIERHFARHLSSPEVQQLAELMGRVIAPPAP